MQASTSNPAYVATLVVIAVVGAFFLGFVGWLLWNAIRPAKRPPGTEEPPSGR